MRMMDYHFFLIVLPFFKCNAIAYDFAFEGVLRSINIDLDLYESVFV
jgi:hypothetical protein